MEFPFETNLTWMLKNERGPAAITDSTFAHHWSATILKERPLIAPSRQFVFPRQAEEVERGALEVMIKPATGEGPFLATFALGFASAEVPTGVWSCPDPQWMCAVAGGYAYLVNTTEPAKWEQVEYRPVLAVTALARQGLLLFSGHQSLVAYGAAGRVWETGRLSWEGVKIVEIGESKLSGLGWDLMTDREFEFQVDLGSGEHFSKK